MPLERKRLWKFFTRIEVDGKIQLPRQVLEKLDFETGQDVELEVEKKVLHVSLTRTERVKLAQTLVKKYVSAEISMADELIEERRREAKND